MNENSQKFDINVDYDEENGTIHDYCTSRGFPLGGIGTGGFSIFTNGGFGKFRTNHNWFKSIAEAEYPKGTFFAVWTKANGRKVAKILRRGYQGGEEFSNVESIQHTEFRGRIPIFDLNYTDEDLPIQLKLTGFTSLIPHNVKDSSLPVAFFKMEINNRNQYSVESSILFSFENILGIGGSGCSKYLLPLSGPVSYTSIKGNYGDNFKFDNLIGVRFGTTQNYKSNNPRKRVIGQYFIFSDFSKFNESILSTCPSWDSKKQSIDFWEHFTQNGILRSTESSGNAGAFAIKFELQPKEKMTINFYVLWWTPYYIIEKKQRLRKLLGIHNGKDYGHYYLQHFSSPEQMIQYVVTERNRLEIRSREIVDLIEKSTLPNWLKTYILNSTDSMLINTALTREGEFYMMEGVPWDWPFGALTGTIDQRLASHPYSYMLFPSLDKNELIGFFKLTKNGKVPHGNGHADIALGTKDIPYGEPIKFFNRTSHWVDLPQSFILQIGKHIIQSWDIDLLKRVWQKIPDMMNYLDETLVNDVPEGITTYDYKKYQPCFIYTAVLHLATLRMAIYLAELLKNVMEKEDPKKVEDLKNFITNYKKQYRATNQSYQDRLWIPQGGENTPEGFFKTCERGYTVFTSALAGDWISRFCGLGPVVDYNKAYSHSEWQSKALVNSHDISIIGDKRTRPLIYREADIEGNEIPVRVILKKKFHVNNPWQTLAYQAFDCHSL
jgi:uncharacterized protein (DUF608 family)